MFYSLIETARANDLEPFDWMTEMLKKLPHATTEDYEDLLPCELRSLKIGSIKRDFGECILEFEQKGSGIHRVALNELALSFLGVFLESYDCKKGHLIFCSFQ